jgi:hypothetical protein
VEGPAVKSLIFSGPKTCNLGDRQIAFEIMGEAQQFPSVNFIPRPPQTISPPQRPTVAGLRRSARDCP